MIVDRRFPFLPIALLLALTTLGCSHRASFETALDGSPPPVVEEAWIAPFELADNVDSVAIAPEHGWVLATTKETHQLLVIDAGSGRLVRRVGAPGARLGQFDRPNGVAVIDDLALVVERDNHRVQVLSLPELEPLGLVGAEILQRPYGIAAHSEDGAVTLWVTDNFKIAGDDPAGDPRLAGRVKVFRLTRDADGISSEHLRSFGETTGRGALWKVETIAVDTANDVLLIAEEHDDRMALLVYSTAGEFTGRSVGGDVFAAEPEGLSLWRDGDDGIWVATDQYARRSVFHLFDRRTFAHLGAFTGAVTANTDGIAVTDRPVDGFEKGVVVAVHDDQAVTAFDWRNVAATLPHE